MKSKKVLFVIPYPHGESPSQRFRFEQYLETLRASGFEIELQSFLPSGKWKLMYATGHLLAKMKMLITGIIRRFLLLFRLPQFDFVFIHREAAPIGPPLWELAAAWIFRRKIIYDFDDAIWMSDVVREHFLVRVLKWRGKVKTICTHSWRVSCGNEYLASYARHFNQRVHYNPTTIDTEHHHNPALYPKQNKSKITVGWTGSHSTLKYLENIEHVLQQLEKQHPQIEILVIADRAPALRLQSLRFLPWRAATEIADLTRMDIGIMPLPDDPWAKGKCGFKILQYMSIGIPSVVSPVGVNADIVQHGTHGYHALTDDDWLKYIGMLIENATLRKEMGQRNRERVIEHYSVLSNSGNFLSLFANS